MEQFFQLGRPTRFSCNNNYDTITIGISIVFNIDAIDLISKNIFSGKEIIPSLPAASGHYVNAFLTVTQRRYDDLANKVEIFCSIAVCLYVNRGKGANSWPVGKVLRFLWVFVASKALRPAARRVVRHCENVFQREARTKLQRERCNDRKFAPSSRGT